MNSLPLKKALYGAARKVMPSWHQAFLRWRVFKRLPIAYSSKAPLSIRMEDRAVGFFSMFFQVLGAIDLCSDRGHNLTLDFRHTPYVDPERGDDWWSYYFDRSRFSFGQENGALVELSSFDELHLISSYGSALAPVVAHRYLSHIRVRPHLAGIVADYVDRNFRGKRVIGVHYRGTDKVDASWNESQRVPYTYFMDRMAEQGNDALFFVATDEAAFLDAMRNRFPTRLLYLDAIRSADGNSVHATAGVQGTGYRAGEEALIDCLLLSQCGLLLRTDSNLSKACSFFNPHQKAINLTLRYRKEHR